MRIDLHRATDDGGSADAGTPPGTVIAAEPDVVGSVTWDGERVTVEASDDETRRTLEHVFRPIAVVTEDHARRRFGTSGSSMIEPGSLEWFLAVAQTRVPAETGLTARFVPGVREGGYDPAAGGEDFDGSVERLVAQA